MATSLAVKGKRGGNESGAFVLSQFLSILFVLFLLTYFLLKDNCFIEFCCFLSNLNMNQP